MKYKTYFLLILLSLFVFLVIFSKQVPLGFDDSYNLQVPSNLVRNGVYASNKTTFDILITTGYPILLSIAAIFKLGGISVIGSRVIMTAFFCLFVYTINAVFDKLLKGKKSALLTSIFFYFFLH